MTTGTTMIVNGRKATRHARREIVLRPPPRGAMKDIPLREHAETALHAYFEKLNGHRPSRLYDLVLREVEEPLFRAVMSYADGNQSRAAEILGINRGTLRKKLKEYGLAN
jgi:Fis family transcriptional regulator, factor for inversion stimulation protein